MDHLLLPTPEADNWGEQFAASLQSQIESARDFIGAHQARLNRAADAIERRLCLLEEASNGPVGPAAAEDFRRRYEMALDDLRDLKVKHAELQRQLAQAQANPAGRAGAEPAGNGRLDWEAEKRRILAALETDLDQNDPHQRAERLKIEDVLHTTEKALAEKNRELEKLRGAAVHDGGAMTDDGRSSAIERILDGDALVREERRRLAELQEQWREKFRQAEIELSVERAKLARWRAELEDRIKTPSAKPSAAIASPENAEPPSRGRWLARLGLTEADRERRKRR